MIWSSRSRSWLNGDIDCYLSQKVKACLYPRNPIKQQVDIIIGGPNSREDNNVARKSYTRKTSSKRHELHNKPILSLKEEEAKHLDLNHDDTLVVLLRSLMIY